jgi:glucose-6-phosphate 1-dehydrogenase
MEPPVGTDSESQREEKAKVLRAIRPLRSEDVVRGQFRGYRKEKGVAPDSKVETFVALRLEIHSWRWQGVPVFIRAGKCLPATCTEAFVRLRPPPAVYSEVPPPADYFRFRVGPEVAIALGAMAKTPGEDMGGERVELMATHIPGGYETDAYVRLLNDAMKGDATHFAREDTVEEAWRIVGPVLGDRTPVHEYDPGAWGPPEAARVAPPGGWRDPVVAPPGVG